MQRNHNCPDCDDPHVGPLTRRDFVNSTHQPPFHPDKPAILSFYIPFYYPGRSAEQQGILGRTQMLSTPYADYEARLRTL